MTPAGRMERKQWVPPDEHDAEHGLRPSASDQPDDEEHRRGCEDSVKQCSPGGRVPRHVSAQLGDHGKHRAVVQWIIAPVRPHPRNDWIVRKRIAARAVRILVVDRRDSAVGPVVVGIRGQQQGTCQRDQLHGDGDDDRDPHA